MSQTYTVKEVADILGYSTNSIYTFLKEKRIMGVRVGQGRFRIPQSEVDRLISGSREKGPTVFAEAAIPTSAQNEIERKAKRISVEAPCLFDWFIGFVSILVGLSLFLFSPYQEQQNIGEVHGAVLIVGVLLVSMGVGVLATGVLNFRESRWHKFFYLVIFLCYLLFTWFFLKHGGYGGVAVFGSLAFVVFLMSFSNKSGLDKLRIYISYLVFVAPFLFFEVSGELIGGGPSGTFALWPGLLLSLFIGSFLSILYWRAYSRQGRMKFLLFIPCLVFTLIAIWYLMITGWVRMIFFLVAAMTSLFIPFWENIRLVHSRQKEEVFNMLGLILGIFVVAVVSLWLIQKSVVDLAAGQVAAKARYGRLSLEETLGTAEKLLGSTAANPLTEQAFKANKVDDLTSIARAVFLSGKFFRRVAFLSASGEVLVNYPLDPTLSGQNMSWREYFSQPMAKPGIQISDEFLSVTAGHPPILAVSTRIVDPKRGTPVGVMLVIIDVKTLGSALQEEAADQSGEYFVVADKAGQWIVHPDSKKVFESAGKSNPIFAGISGKQGVVLGVGEKGEQALIAYDSVRGTGWGIGAVIPMRAVLSGASTDVEVVFFMIGLGSLVVFGHFFFSRLHFKTDELKEDENVR